MAFWDSAELNREFRTIASFYQIQVGESKFQFRNHAIIFGEDCEHQSDADAVVVMANLFDPMKQKNYPRASL